MGDSGKRGPGEVRSLVRTAQLAVPNVQGPAGLPGSSHTGFEGKSCDGNPGLLVGFLGTGIKSLG